MSKKFRIGIAGLGTVGAGVVKILQNSGHDIAARAGREIEIVAVSARNRSRDRGCDLSSYQWVDDPLALLDVDDGLDCVVELIGGADGPALALARAALSKGVSFVTANKALLAHHGAELAQLAEEHGAFIGYEGSVAGGIPIIKALREGFAANEISAVYGILNGTCNYILTEMRETGRDFAEVLKDAQDHGYAEADPTFDIDGIDAAHKLCLLSSLAFGVAPDFDALDITGIRHITATDISFATELGYRIKLLGIARTCGGNVMQVVEPCLVPINSTLGVVEGVFNAVLVEGDCIDRGLLVGRGAGEGPTASAVLADIIDLARGHEIPAFGVPHAALKSLPALDMGQTINSYYMRLNVVDQPGVLADVTKILKELQISIESMIQHGRDPGQPVHIVLTTHEALHRDMLKACGLIEKLDCVLEKPCLLCVEDI